MAEEFTRSVETGAPVPRLSPGYLHAVHPDHGEPVVYTPGQALPEWVRDALAAGATLAPDEHEGSFTLKPRGGSAVPGTRKGGRK